MKRHLTMFGAHQVVDNVTAGSSTARIAEPLLADVAHNDGRSIADGAITTTVRCLLFRRHSFIVFFLGELKVADARSDGSNLAVRDRLRFQLLKAIELERNFSG